MARIMVVDDSRSTDGELIYLLASDPEIEVVGYVRSPEQLLALAPQRNPDVLLINGSTSRDALLSRLHSVSAAHRTPVVVLARWAADGDWRSPPDIAAAGAQALLRTPPRWDLPGHAAAVSRMLEVIKLVAELKIVRRRAIPRASPEEAAEPTSPPQRRAVPKVVAVGASTGGPTVLRTILSKLGPGFPAPLLIVQHMAHGFTQDFVHWLSQASGYPVVIAVHGALAEAGRAYVAPDDYHLGIDGHGHLELYSTAPEHGMRPAVAVLFRSVLNRCGANCTAILLTGMGRDGALELKALRAAGAVTIVQDRGSAAVFGMPGEALKLNAASEIMDPASIGEALAAWGQQGRYAR